MKKILLFIPAILMIAWCSKTPHTWQYTWFYYPNWATAIWDEWVKIQWNLESQADCDKWAYNVHLKSNNETYDYECWYKCRYNIENNFYLCESFE